MLLGDKIKRLLAAAGITEGRVEAVIGRPCGCKKRIAAINNAHLNVMRKSVFLKVWLRMKVAVVMSRARKATRLVDIARNRVVMAWKCIRYGNPHYVASVGAVNINSRKEAIADAKRSLAP